MGDYLRVDLGLLENTAQALGLLRSEFADAAEIARHNEAGVGASELNDALRDFATNWRGCRSTTCCSACRQAVGCVTGGS